MSGMALYRDFHQQSTAACARRGILRRFFEAIARWQQRHVEQEAGRFIAEHGGRVTDDVERQLTEHFNGRGFPPHTPPRSFRPFAGGG